jgi:hypothetical protein
LARDETGWDKSSKPNAVETEARCLGDHLDEMMAACVSIREGETRRLSEAASIPTRLHEPCLPTFGDLPGLNQQGIGRAQRTRCTGLKSGEVASCDTFRTQQL